MIGNDVHVKFMKFWCQPNFSRRDVRLSKELILGAREMLDNVLFLRQQLLKAVEARQQKDPHGAKRCPKNIELKRTQTIRTLLKILELRVLFCAGRRSKRQIRFFLFFQNTFQNQNSKWIPDFKERSP